MYISVYLLQKLMHRKFMKRSIKMAVDTLKKAQQSKFDEFYTQYENIEKEMNAYIDFNPDVFRDKTVLLPCDDPEWSNFTKYFAQNFDRLGLKKLISTSFAKASKNFPHILQLSFLELNILYLLGRCLQ